MITRENIAQVEKHLKQYVPKGSTAYLFGVPVIDLSRESLIGALGYLLLEREKSAELRKKSLEVVKGNFDGNVRPFRRR